MQSTVRPARRTRRLGNKTTKDTVFGKHLRRRCGEGNARNKTRGMRLHKRDDGKIFRSWSADSFRSSHPAGGSLRAIETGSDCAIGHMKRVARMLRHHQPLIRNWFVARGTISGGVVEGFNNKAKLTTKKAYGFRELKTPKIALYQSTWKPAGAGIHQQIQVRRHYSFPQSSSKSRSS